MIKEYINKYRTTTAKTLLGNFTYLSILEVIGILFPLLTYPYLIRVIGAEKYGIIVFSQAVMAYVIIVVNFGFNISATRRVSENRDNSVRLKQIYSSITYLKLIIFLVSFIILIGILYLIKFKHIEVLLLLVGLCLQEIFFPSWFFQGMEKMKYITIVSFLSRLTFLLLIFIVVHEQSDYLLVPVLYSLGGIITSVASIYILWKYFGVSFIKVSKGQMITDVRESLPFFASRISTVIMERSNVVVIGSFFSYEMVAVYDLCSKVVTIMMTPFQLIAQVVYPNVARSKNMNIVRNSIKPVLGFSILLSLIVCAVAYFVVLLLGGEKMMDSVPILRLMVWYVPIVAMSSLFGASTLVVNNHATEYNKSVVYSLIVYLLLICILVLIGIVNLYTMVMAFILPELSVASYRIYITRKYNLLKI